MPSGKATIVGPDIGARMGKIGGAIKAGQAKTLEQAALKAKRIHVNTYKAAIGQDMIMSNVGKRGGKISVRYDVRSRGQEIPSGRIKVYGPAQLIDFDTTEHMIRPTKAGGSRRNRSSLLPWAARTKGLIGKGGWKGQNALKFTGGDNEYRRNARHPGTTGKHVFQRGLNKAQPVITKTMRRSTFNVIKAAAG